MLKKSQILILFVIVFMSGISAFFMQSVLLITCLVVGGITFLLLKKKIGLGIAISTFLFFMASYFYTDFRNIDSDYLQFYAPQYSSEIIGTIVSMPTTDKPDATKFNFITEKLVDDNGIEHKLKAKTLVSIKDENKKFKSFFPGDVLRIKGKLFITAPATNPSQFDYAKYLKQQQIFTIFYNNNDEYTQISPSESMKWKFLQKIYRIKNKIIDTHAKYIPSPKIEVVGGIVLGDVAINPTEEVKDSFIKSGLFHMLAASGMNVAIIFGACYFVFRKLRINYTISILSGMIIVLLYTCMTGFPISLLRATIMIEFVLFGKLINRSANTFALLFFAAFLLLLYNPATINDLGFKLSFLVTFGLLLMAPDLCKLVSSKIPQVLADTICVPLIAQLWVIPIQMYYFNTFTLYSFLANVAIIPFFVITSFLGFACFALSLIPVIGEKIAFLSSFILNYSSGGLIFLADFFSKLPNSSITTFKPSLLSITIYYILLILVYFGAKNKNKITCICCLVLCALIPVTAMPVKSHNCEVIFFSVSDADMILIKSPKNKYFLIDTGKLPYNAKYSQAKAIGGKYLKDNNIFKLENIILTHYDSDHSGGLIDFLSDFKVKKVITETNPLSEYHHKKIANFIKHRHIKTEPVTNNATIYKEKDFQIKTFIAETLKNNENDYSIVTLLRYKDKNILFMGDGSVRTIENLKNYLPHNIDVLKVGHHGAQNSVSNKTFTDFLVKNAVISASAKSPVHPWFETLEFLKKNKINIYRTDTQNAIKLDIKDNLTIYGYDAEHDKWKISTKGQY